MRSKQLCILAGIIIVLAAVAVITTTNRPDTTAIDTTQEISLTADGNIQIKTDDVGTEAAYFNTEIEGTAVEIFAVLASDGTVRLAMNTCQVCNGSPYAYFKQEGDYFICQNCGNRFASDEIGLVSGGCNPVPITADDYIEGNGVITVSESFLKENAHRFTNWKQF